MVALSAQDYNDLQVGKIFSLVSFCKNEKLFKFQFILFIWKRGMKICEKHKVSKYKYNFVLECYIVAWIRFFPFKVSWESLSRQKKKQVNHILS